MSSTSTKPSITIVHKNPVFRATVEAILKPLFSGFDFVHVSKIAERAPTSQIVATQGIPDFGLDTPVDVISFNTEFSRDPNIQAYNREIIADESASPEEISDVLQKHKRQRVLPKGSINAASRRIQKLDDKFAEAETDEKRFEILQEQLEIAMALTGLDSQS